MRKYLYLTAIVLLMANPTRARLSSTNGYWVSSNMANPSLFDTPEEACNWYLDLQGYDLMAIEYYRENGVNCIGYLRDLSRPLKRPGVIGNAGFIGGEWNRREYESHLVPFCIERDNSDFIRKNLKDLYGEQVVDWIIGAKTVALYSELIKHAQKGCEGLSLIPGPLAMPQTQLRSLLLYVLRYTYSIWQRQQSLDHNSPIRLCLLSAALSKKTDFALAQLEEIPLSFCQ